MTSINDDDDDNGRTNFWTCGSTRPKPKVDWWCRRLENKYLFARFCWAGVIIDRVYQTYCSARRIHLYGFLHVYWWCNCI